MDERRIQAGTRNAFRKRFTRVLQHVPAKKMDEAQKSLLSRIFDQVSDFNREKRPSHDRVLDHPFAKV